MQEEPQRFCAIVTLDREFADLCDCQDPVVQFISPAKEKLIKDTPIFLKRRVGAFNMRLIHKEILPRLVATQACQDPETPKSKKKAKPNPALRLQKLVRNFHSRIISAHHRAILTLAPFEARLTLTARLVEQLEHQPRRTILLYVDTRASALYWASELRLRCKLDTDQLIVFFDHALEVKQVPKVVIYTFDQIDSRFEQHFARLADHRRLMTIIVDGCDLLSPEQAVMLLLNEGQFIGYTRHYLHHSQSRSGRMLARFFDDQSILHYTFADAEQDCWLHSFELIPQNVPFETWEEEIYKERKAVYKAALIKAGTEYPSLNRNEYFWRNLNELLDVVADSHTASLFVHREKMEEQPQIAFKKCQRLLELLSDSQRKGIRCLVYDPTETWIKVLTKEMDLQELSFVTASDQYSLEEWQTVLDKLENNKANCLLTPVIPPFGMHHNHIQRLIITTPICSQVSMAAMVDWTLYHGFDTSQTIELHILYVPSTPEETALLEFSDAICGLSFESASDAVDYPE